MLDGDFILAFPSSYVPWLEALVGLILPALPTAAAIFAAVDATSLIGSLAVAESITTSCNGGSPLTTLSIELRRVDCCLSAMASADSGFSNTFLNPPIPSPHVVLF